MEPMQIFDIVFGTCFIAGLLSLIIGISILIKNRKLKNKCVNETTDLLKKRAKKGKLFIAAGIVLWLCAILMLIGLGIIFLAAFVKLIGYIIEFFKAITAVP